MHKRLLMAFTILFIPFLLIACSEDGQENQLTSVSTNETGESEEVADNAVRITISTDDGGQFLNEQEVEIKEGANLLEVLKATFFIEVDEENEITSIERMQADEEDNTSWKLFVNDELSDIPAKDYSLEGGEKIIFDLQ